MPSTRISPKRQITIPQEIIDKAQLEEGDILEASVVNGKIVLTPKRLTGKFSIVKLSLADQKILKSAQIKINKINDDILNSKGLTKKEIEIAAKVGLIDLEQAYFWTEEWQKTIRASEQDARDGHISGPYKTAQELIQSLHS
ncbi:MAG: AbrB/MazE/SpoVT family DNA-binding domain-containing protein [Candidatus Hinthialibacter sp.]